MTKPNDDATEPLDKRKPTPSAAPRLGRYELVDKIGKGGMGIVYRARDTKLDRLVAVKLLLTDIEGDPETRERFVREARAAGELNHRNIIQIYDFGEDDGRAFIVMELLEGASLTELLKTGPELALDRKVEIMAAICEGLAFSHSRSIVHRDLKPGNLFITNDGQVKVLDFGLARIASSNLTRSGFVFGTPDYMSPEQVRGKVVDERSDIFSLGAVFYQMLCGRKPFAAKTLPEIMHKVLSDDPAPLPHSVAPGSLARIVTRCLQKDPLNRYQQVTELLDDLGGVDLDEPAPETDSDDAPKQIGRYRIVEQVGRGGMGVVFRARDPVLNRDVAIKSRLVDFGVDEGARAGFQHEARSAARLQHPNIVTIYEFGEQDDSPYVIMEFLGGDDLLGLMKRDPPLSLWRRLDIVAQLCDGLAFAHEQGVVHRDIKPGNVRVLEDGTVKLLDFGIATAPKGGAGAFAGSAGYASPEQLSAKGVDGRSDLFSVGVLAFELLTGRQPFVGESDTAVVYQVLHEDAPSLRSIAPELPEALEPVLSRALRKEPEQRWATAHDLGDAFRAVAKGLEKASPAGPSTRRAKPRPLGETAGHLDLLAAPAAATDRLADAPLRAAGPATTAPPRAQSRLAGMVAALVLALAGAGGYYGYLGLSGQEASGPPPVDEAGLASGDGRLGAADLDSPGVGPVDPPPVSRTLEVTSEPPGAAVSLDGLETGEETPASFPLTEPYPETIELRLAGHDPASQAMPAVDGDLVEVSFELNRTQGRVALSGAYPFEVWVGNRRYRELADTHELRWNTGPLTVRIRNREYLLDLQYSVEVAAGQPRTVRAPDLGTLSVFSTPGNCEIFVGSQSLDYQPIQRRPVVPGSYTVSRRCGDERENSQEAVTVVSGQDTRVAFTPVPR